MPVTIDEFEVIAETSAPPENRAPSGGDSAPGDPRAAALQLAIEHWQALEAERQWRLDDR